MIRMSFFLDIQALNICFSGHYRRNLFLTFFSFVFAFTANAQSEMPGCTDSNACNYDLTATFDNDSCIYIVAGECDCNGNVLDECGVCGGAGNSFTCWDGSLVCSEADCAATSEFSPTVGITLDNLTEGGTSSLTYTMSQDDGESEIFSSSVVSDGGSFNLSGLALDDVIGSGTLSLSLYAGDFDIESDLVVTNIDNDIYHVFNHVTASNSPVYPIGSIAGGFVISNTATGISISTEVPEDGDFIAEAYSMSLTFDDLFVNPSAGDLTFTSTLTAELGDVDVQGFIFDIIFIDGCTDPVACNYDPVAVNDDGSCVNPDECGVCNGEETGPGAVYECGCADIAEGECDCDGNVLDECGVCEGVGIAEGECDCEGNVLDACGVCGGAGIVEGECDCEGSVLDECGVCGGAGIADGDCDCDGNVLDECGVCGGGGIAEGECDCAGNVLDECGVCGGAGIADGDCDCDGNVLDECGFCGGGGIAEGECDCAGNVIDECGECGGAGISEGECDCEGNVLDECGVCGGAGIADGDCDCDGNVVDECGVCGGAGFAEGECDCEGSVLDECGVCGGDGVDEDCDGICDSIDLCIATCEDPFAPCVFLGCTDPNNPGYDPIATDDDGSCLAGGCTISVACNYNPDAEYLIPGVCEFSSCVGCTDATACNFDADASLSNNFSCNYAEMYYDCDGNCLEDVIPAGGNGVCDPLDVYGCIDSDNPGYNPSATINDGSCLVGGCLIPFACNFDLEADYIVVSLCEFTSCLGCTDEEACNYNPEVTISSAAQCTFPTNPLNDCDGNCINDSDGDDICDEQEIAGCTNDLAINYNEFATDDDGSCSILVGGCVIPFACNFDPAADFYVPGSCDFNFPCGGGTAGMSEAGCTNSNACNYGAEGVPCQFFDAAGNICMIGGCNHPSACNYNDDAQYNDGSCDFSSCATYGCTLSGACNFNDSATYNDGSCDYTSCYGCTNTLSENFDSNATHNDGSCIIHGCTVSVACNYDVTATSENGSCEYSSCMNLGCTDLSACNYDSNAIVSDGSCVTATYGFDCNGNCITDLNNNNICDADDIYGCTDATALNFNNGATMNNGTCLYDTFGCTDEMACNFNHQASSDNGSCEFISCYGCMNDIACNFNVEATHPSECTYVSLYEINGATQTIIGHDELYTYPITTGSDYIWSVIGGEIISGLETNEVIVVWSDVSGSLTVKEISSSGCEGVDVVLNLGSVSSIFDHTVQFSVYPNPANNNIVVVSDLGLSVVTIYDATGRDVYKQQHVNRTNTIDVSNLANGTYRIVADTNEGRRMQTIVISH